MTLRGSFRCVHTRRASDQTLTDAGRWRRRARPGGAASDIGLAQTAVHQLGSDSTRSSRRAGERPAHAAASIGEMQLKEIRAATSSRLSLAGMQRAPSTPSGNLMLAIGQGPLPCRRSLEYSLWLRSVGCPAVLPRQSPAVPADPGSGVAPCRAQQLPGVPSFRLPEPRSGAPGAASLHPRICRNARGECRRAAHCAELVALQHLCGAGTLRHRGNRWQLPEPQALRFRDRHGAAVPLPSPHLPRPGGPVTREGGWGKDE